MGWWCDGVVPVPPLPRGVILYLLCSLFGRIDIDSQGPDWVGSTAQTARTALLGRVVRTPRRWFGLVRRGRPRECVLCARLPFVLLLFSVHRFLRLVWPSVFFTRPLQL